MEKSITLKKVRRSRKHGFLHRMASNDGKKILMRRKSKHRHALTI